MRIVEMLSPSMRIVEMLIPSTNKYTRPGFKMAPKFLTVHETGNTDKGANAFHNAKLQENGNDRQASWHYTVDCGDLVYQSIPDDEASWNAGDGNGPGNRESLAVEICVNSDGNFTKARANAIELLKLLMNKHKIPIQNVVPHHHWSGKDCPRNILKDGWEDFHKLLGER